MCYSLKLYSTGKKNNKCFGSDLDDRDADYFINSIQRCYVKVCSNARKSPGSTAHHKAKSKSNASSPVLSEVLRIFLTSDLLIFLKLQELNCKNRLNNTTNLMWPLPQIER